MIFFIVLSWMGEEGILEERRGKGIEVREWCCLRVVKEERWWGMNIRNKSFFVEYQLAFSTDSPICTYCTSVYIFLFSSSSSCRWVETMSLNWDHERTYCSSTDDVSVWRATVECYWQEKQNDSEKYLSQCQYVHQTSPMDWHGREPRPLRWEAGD
jgi:hypothetical protein